MTQLQEARPAVETVDTSRVPFRVGDSLLIPAERYYDQTFFEAEKKLWMHVWQHACHETEIPNPGDFTEYQILDQSVMLIRQNDGSVKGFYNACRHRGTALACGTGTFRGGQVVCPFHGWRWNLDGSNSYVFCRAGFRPDVVDKSETDLQEVQVGLRYGFVWINFDPDCIPFEENFRGIETALDPHGFEKMHVTWWHQVEFAANWKVAQEAFFEAYHVMQTHPEMAMFLRDEAYHALGMARYYDNKELGHTWADPRADYSMPDVPPEPTDGPSPAELYHAMLSVMWQGARSMTTARQTEIADEVLATVPHEKFFDEFYQRVYAEAAANNVPIPPLTEEMTQHWTAFPSFTGVVSLGCSLAYRARPHPTDPNKCLYDFWALEIPPEGTPVRRPEVAAEDAPTWDDLWFVQQDASNIERMQTGLRTRGHKVNRLGQDLERMIVNWHQVLDRVLAKHM
ncbi:MAG TPA: aromatic ring-hydroxylating dioxygenase subunit alpha [Amycolatopsis sp.]|nr:aromatic ring-hydroxylating dioxygenase subunit alpha [Amycolatopsis sp.]